MQLTLFIENVLDCFCIDAETREGGGVLLKQEASRPDSSAVYYTQPNERIMTLIWPFNATQSQMSQGKLKDHIWFTICVSCKIR